MQNTMRRLLRRLGGTAARPALCNFERRKILSLIDSGLSPSSIVKIHGYTRTEIERVLRSQVGTER